VKLFRSLQIRRPLLQIEGGQKIRYIGIDTPESKHPSKPIQCFSKEATERNRQLVEGKQIQIEKDVNETDRYGRLLRYVYIDDEMINQKLVAEGFAKASAYPPDVKYQELFNEAQRLAEQQSLGLWGDLCLNS
jgi:micrococcal nuclease